jgi:hypothetical protein
LVYNNPSVEDEDAQKEAEEVQSWHGAEPKWTPLYCKGFLASIFSLLSVYVAFDGWVSDTCCLDTPAPRRAGRRSVTSAHVAAPLRRARM